jgi:hypothetical protein
MFIKLSLILVVIALACNAEQKRKYLIKVVESEVYNGEMVLKVLLGQKRLVAAGVAIFIARTKGKDEVKVGQFTLTDLHKINVLDISACKPESFEEKFSPCNEQVRAYPNLERYCDECIRIQKEECKKSLKVVFKNEIDDKSLKNSIEGLVEMEAECDAVGYDLNSAACLADYMSKLESGSALDVFMDDCDKFAKKLERAINFFDLDRKRPVGDLGREYPWLETAARNCGKVEVALRELRLSQEGEIDFETPKTNV